jgi:hypothetical protein
MLVFASLRAVPELHPLTATKTKTKKGKKKPAPGAAGQGRHVHTCTRVALADYAGAQGPSQENILGAEQKCFSDLARLQLAWMPGAPLRRCLLAAAPSAAPLRRAACGLLAGHQHLPASLDPGC